ncbi:MAG: NfeD family protein [Chitinophagales bacterium]
MSLTIIALIVLAGLLLISVEVFLVPGTTIVGVFGLIVLGVGVYFAFTEEGVTMGSSILLGSALLVAGLTYFGFKRMENSQFNVKTIIDSKVNTFNYSNIEVGDEGKTLSALRPEGRAMIKEERVIVYSKGFYIDEDTAIVVVKIKDNKIFVEPKS